MKFSAILILASTFLTACGSQTQSELKDRRNSNGHHNQKPALKLTCEIKVNQFVNGLLKAEVTAKVQGTKTYRDVQSAYADAAELSSVISATDRKCSADGVMKVNTAACSQVANVNTGNVGRYNTFSINGGLSTGYYQCNAI